MRIQVEITGVLRRPQGQARSELQLDEVATAQRALEALGYRPHELRALRLSRRGQVLAPGDRLADGDEVLVFAAVGGG
jgi:molybdopterin converting factor small subunit